MQKNWTLLPISPKHIQIAGQKKNRRLTDSITELQGVVRGYGHTDPCSKPLKKAHYTFDFSQQINCFALSL